MKRLPLLGTVSLLLALSVAPAAMADTSAERAGARAAAQEGAKAYEAGDWKKAIDYFERAEAVVHAPPHLLYIARSHVELGELVEGREAYNRIIREQLPSDAPRAFVRAQEDAQTEIEGLDGRIPRVTVTVQGDAMDEVVVLLDGKEIPNALVGIPQPTNPGKHTYQAKAGNMVSEEHTVDVAEGGEATVMLTLRQSEAAPVAATAATPEDGGSKGWSGMKVAGVTSLGVSAAGAIAGGVFLGLGASKHSEANDLYDACTTDCSTSEIAEIEALDDKASTQGTIGVIALGVGGAALITGVTLLILDGKQNKKDKSASLEPSIAPWFGFGSAGVKGTF